MSMGKRGLILLGLSAASGLHAQENGRYVWEEYGKRLSAGQTISPTGTDLFGEQISLYDGSLSFKVTDVSLPGNNALPVAFTRTFTVRDRGDTYATVYNDFPLEDWEIALPNISGQFAQDWISSVPGEAGRRCSAASALRAAPPSVKVGTDIIFARDFWNGNALDLGDAGGGELLYREAATPVPANGETYYWVTNDHVRVSCLAGLQNWPGGGEGFMATTADGTRYWFNWMARFSEPTLIRPFAGINGSPRERRIARTRNALYATRVEDRHGNYVDYNYSNAWNAPLRLDSIVASDGRRIDVQYNGANVSAVTAAGRTWTYAYQAVTGPDRALSSVTQPDGTQWQIALAGLHGARIEYQQPEPDNPRWRTCLRMARRVGPQSFMGWITHPTGAVGQFELAVQRLGRTNVPVTCDNFTTPYNDETDDLPSWPIYYDGLALKKKTITGAGLSPLIWTYDYHAGYSFYYPGSPTRPVCPPDAGDCSLPRCTSDDCAGVRTNTVYAPDGSWTRYVHGNSFRYNESKLLRTEIGSGTGAPLRVEYNTYDFSGQDQAYPARWGTSSRRSVDGFTSEYHRPQTAGRVDQQGVSFQWTADAMDGFARPTQVTRASTLAGSPSKTVTTSYYDNLSRWVIGQPANIAVNGLPAWQTQYDANTALPVIYTHFGQTVQHLSYHSDGNVSTVTDGNGNQVQLGHWKRGIPQHVRYPATPEAPGGATQTAVVNDSGWITATTDENGLTTHYHYDTMGRVSQIILPGEDRVAWNPTLLALDRLAGPENGIPAGHWRHTVSTGTGTTVSYLDALWRPVLIDEYDSANVAVTRSAVRKRYDLGGRESFSSYPADIAANPVGTSTAYDALGRHTQISNHSELGPLVNTVQYLDGFVTRSTDPKGHYTDTSFLAWDQPQTELPSVISQPEGVRTEIQRDAFGKPLSIIRMNSAGGISLPRRYVYDTRQRLCKTIEPETGATLMGYDPVGNLIWSRAGTSLTSTSSCDSNAIPVTDLTVRQYDGRNRLTALLFPDGYGDTTFSYTPDGKLAQAHVQNAQGAVTSVYSYNNRRLLTAEAVNVGTNMWGIGYGYNANGHLQTHSLPGDLAVNYSPDGLGRPTQAGGYATDVQYHHNNAIKSFVYGNGAIHTLDQNARGLPDRRRDIRGTSVAQDEGYDYDHNGNVAAISDGLPDQLGNRTMRYDALDRLLGVVSPAFGAATYSYDVLDNIKSTTIIAGSNPRNHVYGYDASNRLTSISDAGDGGSIATLGYDARGNLARKNGRQYRFDHGNRLREVIGVERYDYDVHGRRTTAVVNGGAIYSMYGMDGVLRFQHDERSGKSTQYVHLGNTLVARVEVPIALATPTLLVPPFSADGNYTVSWTTTGQATRHELDEQAGSGAWANAYSGAGISKAYSAKPTGTYGYRVRACSATECGTWSGTAPITVGAEPINPPALSSPALGLNGGYTVHWSAVASANSYQLQESVEQGPWTRVQDTAATKLAFSGRPAGSYRYRVNACNLLGCSAFSAEATVQVVWPPSSAPDLTVPSSSYDGAVTAGWTAVATSTRYELVQRYQEGIWEVVHSAAALSRTLTGRAAGTYDYQVRACNAAGCSDYSVPRTLLVTLPPVGVPTLDLPALSNSASIHVSWSATATTTIYHLQHRIEQGDWIDVSQGAGNSATVDGLGTATHGFRVRSCNVAGCAVFSAERTVAVLLPPSAAPVISGPTVSGQSQFTLSWIAVPAATHYALEESADDSNWEPLSNQTQLTRNLSKPNGTWRYRVQACNAGGCGPYSGVHAITIALNTPGIPTGLTVRRSHQNEFCTIRWNAVAEATSFKVSRASYNGPDLSTVHTTPCLPWYTVAACNANGCSAESKRASAPRGTGGGVIRPDQEGQSP